jgi:16S rRNA A1518/A1519 N6-dimethyltransferase RsmA/KsgA/DIM1 with predicted DNA glycosylase/AP lyase activity
VGSGLGLYAQELADRGLHVTATEADHGRLAVLSARFADSGSVRVEELTVPVEREELRLAGVVQRARTSWTTLLP